MSVDPHELGPYRIVRPVGRGGMGIVYEAVHVGLDKRVALKVLPRGLARERLDRFLREARTAAALHHTNIVPVFDVGEFEGVPYYAMQFIDGQALDVFQKKPAAPWRATMDPPPLATSTKTHAPPHEPPPADAADAPVVPERPASVVTRSLPTTASFHRPHLNGAESAEPARGTPSFSPRRAVELALQAAEGLAYAHERGVVHRDIKPSNLILDSAGVVWVADFGLAFRADDPSMTGAGAVLGTPRYMSPEQARGEKPDARTDVYSLGVTLYELLTGVAAFPGDTPFDVIQKVLTVSPPQLRAWNRNIPLDLETVVLKAMAKRPEDRYLNGREFAADLRRFLAGEPVKARRISVVGKAWRWSKRNPAVASLLAAVFLVFALGASVSAYFARQARDSEREARGNEVVAKWNEKVAREQQAEANERQMKLMLAERHNRRLVYAAKMTLAGQAFQSRDFDRVIELLRDTLPQPGEDDMRDWEWHALFRYVKPDIRTTIGEDACQAVRDRWALKSTTSRLVRAFEDSLEVYDSQEKRVLCTLAGPYPEVKENRDTEKLDVLLSPDGEFVAGWDSKQLVVWNANTGQRVYMAEQAGRIEVGSELALGPKGLIIHQTTRFGEYRLGRLSATVTSVDHLAFAGPDVLDLFSPKCFAFSADGRRLAVVVPVNENRPQDDFAHEIQIYNLTDPSRLPLTRVGFPKNNGFFSGLQFHANSKGLIAWGNRQKPGTDDREDFLQEVPLGESFDLDVLAEGSPAHNLVDQVLVSPCKRWVARIGRVNRGTVVTAFELWDRSGNTRRLLLPDVAGDQPVTLDWSPDGARAVLAVDVQDYGSSSTAAAVGWPVFAPRYRHARTIRLLDPAAGRILAEVPSPLSSIYGPVFSPCGRWICIEGVKDWVILDAVSLDIRFRSDRPTDSGDFKFIGNGKFATLDGIPTGTKTSGEKEVRHELSIWDADARKLIARHVVSTPVFRYNQLIAGADRPWIGVYRMNSGDTENELLVFNAADQWATPRTIPLHNAQGYENACDPTGRLLAFQIGTTVTTFDTTTWERTHSVRVGKPSVTSLFAPNTRRLIVYSELQNQNNFSVWDLERGEQVFGFQCRPSFASLDAGKLTFRTFDETDPTVPLLDGTPVPLDVARERLGVK